MSLAVIKNEISFARTGLGFVLSLLLFIPLNFTVGQVSGKPLDIVPADILLCMLFPFVFMLPKMNKRVYLGYTWIIFFYFSACLVGVFLSVAFEDGGEASVASFLRPSRTFFLYFSGVCFFQICGQSSERILSVTAAFVVVLIFFSDVFFNPLFPSPRWGGYLGDMEVYGFPNSPGFLYVVFFAFIVTLAKHNKMYLLVAGVSALTIILLSSRNSMASLFLLVVVLCYFRVVKLWIIALSVVAIMVFLADAGLNLNLLSSKFDRTLSDGVLYGRDYVWQDVLGLALDRPVFGYGFEPLSFNYSKHDTAHNQYIEYFYKSGLIGFLLVALLWGYIILTFNRARVASNGFVKDFYAAIFSVILVALLSNIAQPNFSYTVTQGVFVFVAGVSNCRLFYKNQLRNE